MLKLSETWWVVFLNLKGKAMLFLFEVGKAWYSYSLGNLVKELLGKTWSKNDVVSKKRKKCFCPFCVFGITVAKMHGKSKNTSSGPNATKPLKKTIQET